MFRGRAEVGSRVRDAERNEVGQISGQGVERAWMYGETLDGQLPDLALCRSEQGEETLGGDPLAASDGQSAKARQVLCNPGEELVRDDGRVLGQRRRLVSAHEEREREEGVYKEQRDCSSN